MLKILKKIQRRRQLTKALNKLEETEWYVYWANPNNIDKGFFKVVAPSYSQAYKVACKYMEDKFDDSECYICSIAAV